MKLYKMGFLLFLMSFSLPTFALTQQYTQNFDSNGVHYILNFTADSSTPTVITALTNSFAGTTPLTLSAPGTLGGNNNRFYPGSLNPNVVNGWDDFGLAFYNTADHLIYNIFHSFPATSPWLSNSDASVSAGTTNFSTTVTVDEPAVFSLLVMVAFVALWNRRKLIGK